MARIRNIDWRREDSVYAVASAAALALIAFLVAGTFGLVASPFGPAPSSAELAVPVRTAPAPTAAGETPGPSPVAAPAPSTPAAATASAGDVTPPRADIASAGGTEVTLLNDATITGTAADAASGVSEVVVSFTGGGEPSTVAAELSCRDATRRSCSWSADVPSAVGSYEVRATALDRSGNAGQSEPVRITVVDLGGAVADEEDGLLPRVGAALRSLIG